MSEQTTKSNTGESSNLSRKGRIARRAAGVLLAGTASFGAIGTAAAGHHNAISGTAIASAEAPKTYSSAQEYVLSQERNDKLGSAAELYSERIIADQQAHPSRAQYTPDKGSSRTGTLTDTITRDGQSFKFSVHVRDEGGGVYKYDQMNPKVTTKAEKPTDNNMVQYAGTELGAEWAGDGLGSWDASFDGGERNNAGQGMGGGSESGWDAVTPNSNPNIVPLDMQSLQEIETQAMQQAAESLNSAGIA